MKNIKLEDSIIELNSYIKGPVTTIMCGVHGDETIGIQALLELKNNLKIIKGTVYIIFANLKAIEIGKRIYEKDLNRCFFSNNKLETYEDFRAKEIIGYLNKSDYLLDIHNTENIKDSTPFLISEYKELGRYFDVDFIVSGFDSLHKGSSDGYLNSIGKIGFSLEAGCIYDSKGINRTKKQILNFLRFTGNILGKLQIYTNQTFINFNTIYKNKSINFLYEKEFKNFDKIQKGEIIVYDSGDKIIAEDNIYIIFAYNPKKIGESCFCLGYKK